MSLQQETITLDEVKNWDGKIKKLELIRFLIGIKIFKSLKDAKRLLRLWRDENIRNSKDVVELWERLVHSNIGKFGDESTENNLKKTDILVLIILF